MDWYPAEFFTHGQPERPYVLLLLNQRLNIRTYRRVMDHASMIVCADGGANQWLDMYTEDQSPPDRFPEAVIGDLDSLRRDVRDSLEIKGKTRIVHDHDQDSTDFTKALQWLSQNTTHFGDQVDVLVLGGLGGRVDQGLSMMHHMIRALLGPDLLSGDMYLLSEQSLSFVLRKGQNTVHGLLSDDEDEIFSENVGILPVRGPAIISTAGLEWDVQDWETEFGVQVSTSNHVRADDVRIEATEIVLFTIELADALCARPGAAKQTAL